MSTLIIDYKPRDAFRGYHNNTKRFSCSVCHRRAGKSVARLNQLIRKAIECTKLNPRFGYISPFYVQSKEIAWAYLKHYTSTLEPLGLRINESELSITFGHNNAMIKLYGAENAERIRGLYFDGIVVDEAQGISSAVLRTIIMPALSDRQGWLDLSGTPKGWKNLLGEIVKIAQANPDDWFLHMLPASESGILPVAELEMQRKLMSSNEYDQEYEISFDAAITGAVYGKQMAEMQQAGRIAPDLYDKNLLVHTAWDLGYSDDTAIWFYQVIHGEVHFIDFYTASGKSIEHYAAHVLSKPYRYKTHFLPHDARAKTLASGGKSVIEMLAEHLSITKMAITPSLSMQDGIQATRMMMPRAWFDKERCHDGLEALKQYQREWDDDKKMFRDKPRHDWTSHAADSMRYAAINWKEEVKPVVEDKPIRGIMVGQTDVTLNELWAAQPTKQPKRI